MSLPVTTVLVGFQTTADFGQPFQLDDAVYGMLDTGTLGGYQMVDMTDQVMSVTTTRGRNRELEQFNAGTASIKFRDPQRVLDPLNEDSPYWPYVGPRQPVEILVNGYAVYSGFVTDWDLDYNFAEAGNVTTASCADGFTVFANQTMNAWTPTEQASGARVEAVLDLPEVTYQGGRFIDAGQSTLGDFAVTAGTNVLQYLQLVTASEQGYLFMNWKGSLVFKDRASVLNALAETAFTDDGSGIPYTTITNAFGDELLYNYIQTQSPAGAVQTTNDPTSQALYQSQQYSKLDLLNSTEAEVAALGDYLLGRYKDPVLRFTGIGVQMAALTDEQQSAVLTADLCDVVSVRKSFAAGTPSSVTKTVIVSGISHNITPGTHQVSFTFESTDQNQYLTLDNDVFGHLDANLLAF